jgi:hypothetical protein
MTENNDEIFLIDSDLERLNDVYVFLQFYLYLKNKYPSLVFNVDQKSLLNDLLENKNQIKVLLDEVQIDKKTGENKPIEIPKNDKLGSAIMIFLPIATEESEYLWIEIHYNEQEYDFFVMQHTIGLTFYEPGDNYSGERQRAIHFYSHSWMEHKSKRVGNGHRNGMSNEMIRSYKNEEEIMQAFEGMIRELKNFVFREMFGII